MKIAHVIDYFQPQLGYQETYLALEQIKGGHTVKVFTGDRYHPFPNYDASYRKILGKRSVGCGESVEHGINVTHLKVLLEFSSRVRLKGLKEAIIGFNPDLIICHSVTSFTAYTISKTKFNSKVKIIFDDHMGGTTKENRKRLLMRYFYLMFFKKSIEASAYKIIGVTYTSIEYLRNKLCFNKEKLAYIPLGFDPDIFYFSQKYKDEIRTKFNILPSEIVGIYTGKINKDKGIKELVDALKYLFQKYNNFKFIFIGNGEIALLNKIKNELPINKLIIEDFMSQEKLCRYYSAADFAIWPDGITVSHIEAMACKLPIIVSSLPASIERVAHNNGIYLRKCSKDEICKAIELFLNNKELMKEYSLNSLRYAETLSWKALNEKLLAL